MISGTLTLGANHASNFFLPYDGEPVQGTHCTGRYAGTWGLTSDKDENHLQSTIHLPQRDKRIDMYAEGAFTSVGGISGYLSKRLETLDSEYEGQTQLYKLNQVLHDIPENLRYHPYAAVLNTVSTHSSFALLSFMQEIQLVGVHDPQLGGSYLAWSTHASDLANDLRARWPLKYLIYRFPTIRGHAVFIPTQAICAHWYKYLKNNHPLFAFNALELKLFK